MWKPGLVWKLGREKASTRVQVWPLVVCGMCRVLGAAGQEGFTWPVQPLALSRRQQEQGAPQDGLIPQGFQQDLVKEMCWGHFRAEGSKAIPEKPSSTGLCVHMSVCPSMFLCRACGGTQCHWTRRHHSQHDLEALGIQSFPSIIILSAN